MLTPTGNRADAGGLSSLVNAQKIRSSIKRLFQNDAKEFLTELVQNATRANAGNVTISTSEKGFAFQDDGHGLLDGVTGFHVLLKIAESHFDNAHIEEMMPMGLGVCALLSHDKVTRVTFESGTLGLAVDTALWWEDSSYAESWHTRLHPLAEPMSGLRVLVECDEELVKQVRAAFKPEPTIYSNHLKTTPAQGQSTLNIALDGQMVDTGLPDWAVVREPMIMTEYQGCALQIGFSGNSSLCSSSVAWYGQVIPVSFPSFPSFQFHLEVRAGRPVNPRSPTRQGLIEDDSFHALISFVTDQIFSFLCDEKNRSKIRPSHIAALHRLNGERAREECPYVVARPFLPLGEVSSMGDIDARGKAALFTYAEAPSFLGEHVTVIEGKTVRTADYGISSFLSMIGPAYNFICGDDARVEIRHVWWKPHGKAKHYFFHKRGKWALASGDSEPVEWMPVTAPAVFAFSWPDNTDFSSVDWVIGCANVIDFLNAYAWAGFNPDSDERDYDDIKYEYDESVTAMVRAVMGKCVRAHFHPYDLPKFFADQSSPICCIRFHHKSGVAKAITVTNKAGESVRLKLL